MGDFDKKKSISLDFTGLKIPRDYLVLREEVRQFFTSDASDEDKRKLSGYTEALSMVCAAIDDGLLDK